MFKIVLKYIKCIIFNMFFKIMIFLYCMFGCILVYWGFVCMQSGNVYKLVNVGIGIKLFFRVKVNVYCLDYL